MTNAVEYLKAELRNNGALNVGERVPAIHAKSLDGKLMTVDFSGSVPSTILYVFTPTCIWCNRNLQNVKTLSDRTAGRYRFVGISLSRDQLQEYVTQHSLTFAVLNDLSAETVAAYKLGGTPQTLVISPQGEILKVWFGAYDGSLLKEIEQYFQVQLPGIGKTDKDVKTSKEDCETCDQKSSPQPRN